MKVQDFLVPLILVAVAVVIMIELFRIVKPDFTFSDLGSLIPRGK